MIKCLAFICLLGLTVSAWEFDNKRSNRMNLLSKTVGARMLAGTNDFPGVDSSFVPIPRQGTPAISNIVDNGINGQLTADQIAQLHQFISSQSVGQQQQFQPSQQVQSQQTFGQQFQSQPVQQQTVGQQQQTSQFQQQQPGQQTFGQQFQSPAVQQQQNAQFQQQQPQQTAGQQQFQSPQTVGQQQTSQFQQQPTQQQFGQPQQQFRMDSFNTNPMTFDNTQQQQQFGRIVSGQATTTTTTTPAPVKSSKPSPLEQQQLLDQQFFNIQQQQTRLNQQQPQQQTVVPTQQQQQPISPLQQQQLLQQQQQQQQFVQQQQQQVQQQKLIEQQQQLQQQQLTQRPQQQQQPVQKVPQMQVVSVAQPVLNVSRIAAPVRQQQPVFQQQQQQPVQQRGRNGDICAGAIPGDKIPHPIVETQYVVCGELGEIYIMDCPIHTVFNPHLKLCDLTTEFPALCKSNPCLNGAKCVEVSDVQFRCECPLGFSGQTCEKFDTCSTSQPCGQDGVCLSFALGSPIPHVCLCNGGRSVGMTCAQSEQNPCLVQGSSAKLMPVNFNRAVFAHCEGARPHFKFCQPPLMFSPTKQACEWTI